MGRGGGGVGGGGVRSGVGVGVVRGSVKDLGFGAILRRIFRDYLF